MQNENDEGQRSHGTSIVHEKVLGRILALSDGVFAFAITLLVLNLVIPDNTTYQELPAALIALLPKFKAFLISFFVIGLFWISHVRQLRVLNKYSPQMLWINLFFLLFIVLIPFTTIVISDFSGSLSVIVYAVNISLAGCLSTILWVYATHNLRLVDKNLSPEEVRRGIMLDLVAPVIFTLSIGIALINSDAALYSWTSVLVLHVIMRRAFKVPKTDDNI